MAREEMQTQEFLDHMATAVQVRVSGELQNFAITRKAPR
jgi:hypothetical protein